jgi:hypothetical protein
MKRLCLRPNQLSSPHNVPSWRVRVVWPTRTKTLQLFVFASNRGVM